MTEYKFEEDYDVIESYMKAVIAEFGKPKWTGDNSFEVLVDKETIGQICFDDKKVTIIGDDSIINFIKELEKKKAEALKPLSEEELKKSVFKYFKDEGKQHSVNGLFNNSIMLRKLDKLFKDVGIEAVIGDKSLNKGSSVNKKLTLFFDYNVGDHSAKSFESGWRTRLQNSLFDKYKRELKAKENLNLKEVYDLNLFEKEKAEDIKLGEIKIGRYFPERNTILLLFNPFMIEKILPLTEEIPRVFDDLAKLFLALNLESQDTTQLEKKIFISSFMESSRSKLQEIDSNMVSYTKGVSDYEKQIQDYIRRINDLHLERRFISETIDSKGDKLFDEIEKVKLLPFIKKLDLGTDNIKILFKESTIKAPAFSRGDHSKTYGARTMYLGEIEFKIGPGVFEVKNKDPFYKTNPHPHADAGSGKPCFGDGDGRNKIYELLAANQFQELAKMLWFWIKIYRNEGAYVKQWDSYDWKLANGYPVWDDKGNRIEINDKDRIKSGEQKELTKSETYEENIKRFKDMKIF